MIEKVPSELIIQVGSLIETVTSQKPIQAANTSNITNITLATLAEASSSGQSTTDIGLFSTLRSIMLIVGFIISLYLAKVLKKTISHVLKQLNTPHSISTILNQVSPLRLNFAIDPNSNNLMLFKSNSFASVTSSNISTSKSIDQFNSLALAPVPIMPVSIAPFSLDSDALIQDDVHGKVEASVDQAKTPDTNTDQVCLNLEGKSQAVSLPLVCLAQTCSSDSIVAAPIALDVKNLHDKCSKENLSRTAISSTMPCSTLTSVICENETESLFNVSSIAKTNVLKEAKVQETRRSDRLKNDQFKKQISRPKTNK